MRPAFKSMQGIDCIKLYNCIKKELNDSTVQITVYESICILWKGFLNDRLKA